jgi:hypothetical protein
VCVCLLMMEISISFQIYVMACFLLFFYVILCVGGWGGGVSGWGWGRMCIGLVCCESMLRYNYCIINIKQLHLYFI